MSGGATYRLAVKIRVDPAASSSGAIAIVAVTFPVDPAIASIGAFAISVKGLLSK